MNGVELRYVSGLHNLHNQWCDMILNAGQV